jgi:hypothetical protein
MKNSPDFLRLGIILVLFILFIDFERILANKTELSTGAGNFFADPVLSGPDNLCVIFGSAIADFSGGGAPTTDVYDWVITNSMGGEHFTRNGGATFQNISVQFSQLGNYTVTLSVRRGNDIIYTASKNLSVIQGPQIVLQPDYLLCGNTPAILTAINPSTPNIGQYTFEWTNAAGDIVGNQNELSVQDEGYYFISLFLTNSSGGTDCQINGGTYVGQPRDFRLSINSNEVCMGENIEIGLDTPIPGQWFVQKIGETDLIDFGSAYSLSLDSEDDLFGSGSYRAVFRAQDSQYPDCVSEREISFSVKSQAEFTFSNIVAASGCSMQDGGFLFTAQSDLDFLRINELSLLEADLSAGETRSFINLYPGIYVVEAQLDGCNRTEVVIIPNANPDPTMLFETVEIGESCSETGKVNGIIRVNLLNGPYTGEYRVVEASGAVFFTGAISNVSSFDVSVPGNNYAIEIISPSGCKLPENRLLDIPVKEFVPFSIPEEVTICGALDFVPVTEENLTFTLISPSGTVETKNAGEAFVLTQSGNYILTGTSLDPSPEFCPRTILFNVVNIAIPNFEPVLESEDCFGNKLYKAELFGVDPSTVSIRWYDENLKIVGRGEMWYPTAYGKFSLDVQPRGSSLCGFNPKPFEVRQPVFEVDVTLTAGLICGDGQFATVTMDSDFEEVDRIEWIFIAADGTQTNLTQFANEREIEAGEEGTYEVVVYNRIGCEIGRDLILVLKSYDEARPEIKPFYSICTESNYGEIVNPGSFETYEWFLNGEFISDEPTLNLRREGNYTLLVTNSDGCVFESSFSTFEDCTFQAILTTGMNLSDVNKHFEVYVNDAVEKAQIWIHNRNGELIHFCENNEIQSRVAFCQWDGLVRGKEIPVGSYTVTLRIISTRFGLEQKFIQNLVVFD